MKVAFVHEWLVNYAGSERVLEQMLKCYPEADLFSVVDYLEKDERGFILNKSVQTTFVQKLPFAKRKYRQYLALMPLAIEQLDLSSYDVVISSNHAVAKGVITGPDQLHLCMCYSPMRYAWDLQNQYLKESGLDRGLRGWLAKWILHKMRLWDVRTVYGVDGFVAISKFIKRRIKKVYGRDSLVIYPPVDTANFSYSEKKQDYYLTASRMVPYKKIDLIVQAFNLLDGVKLLVIGDGPDYDKIKVKAGKNVELLGFKSNQELITYMQGAKAFVFAAEEDFGIVPLEAQSCGTPVIAFGKGGAKETIIGFDREGVNHSSAKLNDPPTGLFFQQQSVEDIRDAVCWFESHGNLIKPSDCHAHAKKFSPDRFRNEFKQYVDKSWAVFRESSD